MNGPPFENLIYLFFYYALVLHKKLFLGGGRWRGGGKRSSVYFFELVWQIVNIFLTLRIHIKKIYGLHFPRIFIDFTPYWGGSFVLSHVQNTKIMNFLRNDLEVCLKIHSFKFFYYKNVSKSLVFHNWLEIPLLEIRGPSDYWTSLKSRLGLYSVVSNMCSLVTQENTKLQLQTKWDQRYLVWVLHGNFILQSKIALFIFNQFWVIDCPLNERDGMMFQYFGKGSLLFFHHYNKITAATLLNMCSVWLLPCSRCF